MTAKTLKIAFIVNYFPVLSETFIVSELQNLLKRKIDLDIYSLFRSDKSFDRADLHELSQRTVYMTSLLSVSGLLRSHLYWLFRHPLRYLDTFFFACRYGNVLRLTRTAFAYIFFRNKSRKRFSKSDRQNLLVHFIMAAPLAQRIDRGRYNLVHGHFADAATSFAMLIARLCGIPYSFTTHATDLFVEPALLPQKLAGAAFVLTCTGYNKEYITNHFKNIPAHKVILNYHGVDADSFSPVPGAIKDQPPLLLSVGRLVPKKGFDTLLQACALLQKQNVAFNCLIIGDGPERHNLEEICREQNLHSRVTLPGVVAPPEVKELLARAAIFVLPCRIAANGDRDGIPNVLAEAMAMQVCVISTAISGIPEIIEHEKSGFLLQPDSPGQLAETLKVLLENPQLGAATGTAARQRVMQIFDKQQKCNELVDIFVNRLQLK
ncbi:MAG TPA: glycosyltransferase family 4 protein [bacterium]|nr:glycosyltransferase family 4 protein [bacterium]HPN44919.1 glycosyltransferase family 4 protein [bacterium]